MRNTLWMVVLFGLAVAVALMAGGNHGSVTLFWAPYRVDMSLNLTALLLLLLFAAVHLALRTLSALFSLPHQARRWRRQQKERAMHGSLLEALAHLMTGRYLRAVKASEKALSLESLLSSVQTSDDPAPRHVHQLRVLAHLVAAESAQALHDRDAREHHLQAVQDLASVQGGEVVEETLEAAYLSAARWSLSDRDAPQAIRWLDSLRQGPARRMLALRMRLKAARLSQQPQIALETARLLAKHGAFSDAVAPTLVKELVVAALNEVHDSVQLQRAWEALDAKERAIPVVTLHAAQRMIKLGGDAQMALFWLTPLWNRIVQQGDSAAPQFRQDLIQTLVQILAQLPVDPEWLVSIDRARQIHPGWAELHYLCGMVCWQQKLWGKAQQTLELAAPQLEQPEMQRQAWRILAMLAEQKEETARAQSYWKRAAEVGLV